MSDAARNGGLDARLREGGFLPTTMQVEATKKKRKEHAGTGFTAATMRALSARMLTFYFRAPIKAFFRPRIEAINPNVKAGQAWSWRMTSPALLFTAVQQQGWAFLPNQVLPPLLANTAVGTVLYTAYLQIISTLHQPNSLSSKRVFPPPSFGTCFTAGFLAGTVQSVIAAPLDALQVRFQSTDMIEGKYRNMWHYGLRKTQEIGARGVFAGWTLSLLRDSLGAGIFFATFETVKSQAFYGFVSRYYGSWTQLSDLQRESISVQRSQSSSSRPEIRPHYMVEPTFLLLAGVAASVAQAFIQHPLSRIQEIHYGRLEWIDQHTHTAPEHKKIRTLKLYAAAYRKTMRHVLALARRDGGLRQWLFRHFVSNTIRQTPSTAAGLIVFEVIRRKWGFDEEPVRIPKDGYEILLT
ncbi:hypothetical protein CKM354_000137600 [Cercospora kikuchii]|uniref:Mitochondrial carrier n=1 Tax=Cercospora kikuchii TaxID=84275 RepID=A0A9P3CFX4_9PEZI|nr:uncharacterized protein CKM354_000137600 [Cercospora kikuchii]GIZ37948.1 hypothetical protein CKM354_000137600 [Cercospora kikuchii]